MILPSTPLGLLPLLLLVSATVGQLNGIDRRDIIEEVEHIFVDNRGTNSDGFVNAVSPCANYIGFASNAANRGEQSSAQWVRFVFHDSVTANLTAGTGGVDASLGFESNRPENLGLFVNDTLQFMVPTVSAYMSMADNIALGLIVSLIQCGGSNTGIPLRAGRVDADAAGPFGVPEPTTDLVTTLAQFEAAGFNQAETIALTACGHSIGHVHFSNNPDIIDASAVTATNLDGGVPFDSTPASFDNAVVNEYLNATGSLGGPLVTASNETDRSDLRLYISDNNVTMQGLTEEAVFQAQCNALFERMVNTVPAAVTLTDPITPMVWKGVNIILDISSAGAVSVSGLIRNLHTTIAPPSTVPYTTIPSAGNSSTLTSNVASGSGTSIFGNTTYWAFNTTLASPGTTSVNFGDVSYPINDEIFILPAQSTVSRQTRLLNLKAAALTSLTGSMSAVLYVPTAVQGTISKKIVNTTVAMTAYGTAGDYTLYSSGNVTLIASVIAKVILGDAASRTVKSKIFVGGFEDI